MLLARLPDQSSAVVYHGTMPVLKHAKQFATNIFRNLLLQNEAETRLGALKLPSGSS